MDEYTQIYSILDKVNLKGITYRSKYENDNNNIDNESNINNKKVKNKHKQRLL